MTEPRIINLPVCAICNRVSVVGIDGWSGHVSCTGDKDHRHKRERMTPKPFKEMMEEKSAS